MKGRYELSDSIAPLEVFGIDNDSDRRRAVRADAGDLLRPLGFRVEVEPRRDVFEIVAARRPSANENLQMLQRLGEVFAKAGSDH